MTSYPLTSDADSQLDVVLINPGGREKIYQQLGVALTAVEPPLWCRLIAGYLRDRGVNLRIIDSEAEEWGVEAVARCTADLKPRLIAVIVFGHQPSASTQMMSGASELCRTLKAEMSDTPLIIVGGHVSALPERTIREEAVDFACKGEGAVTIMQLIEALRMAEREDWHETDWSAIQGLIWRDNQNIRVNPVAPLITNLDEDLHGMVWDLLPMKRYRAHNWQCFGSPDTRMPYASIYTSLGCPYKCSFCCINAPFDANRYRMRKPERVVAEVNHLYKKYRVKTFKIVDEMFVLNERHVLAICDGLAELGYADQLNFWAYSRVDTVKPHMLEKLRRGGIRWLALGIESGSKHVRDGADKRLKYEDIIGIVREIQKSGINVIGNFIFGLPDDTVETMRETLELAKELNCEFANFYSAMAYPGSPLYESAVANNWALPETWSGFSQHSYDCQPLPTEFVSAAEVLRFRDSAFGEYFGNSKYLDMVAQRFGWDTRHEITEMTKHKLRRKLFETPASITDQKG
jgi:anaerobic magnesium-protoporphyrin IX monomethyl ester cyclase